MQECVHTYNIYLYYICIYAEITNNDFNLIKWYSLLLISYKMNRDQSVDPGKRGSILQAPKLKIVLNLYFYSVKEKNEWGKLCFELKMFRVLNIIWKF